MRFLLAQLAALSLHACTATHSSDKKAAQDGAVTSPGAEAPATALCNRDSLLASLFSSIGEGSSDKVSAYFTFPVTDEGMLTVVEEEPDFNSSRISKEQFRKSFGLLFPPAARYLIGTADEHRLTGGQTVKTDWRAVYGEAQDDGKAPGDSFA